MNTNEEQWLTGFAEGDGTIDSALHGKKYLVARVVLTQKGRDVLDFIASKLENGRFNFSSGKHCIPQLR